MSKKFIFTGLCILLLAATTVAAAESVYITENGTKYHKAECRFVRNKDALKLDKSEAIEQGYTPCARCFQEDLISSGSQDTTGSALSHESQSIEHQS